MYRCLLRNVDEVKRGLLPAATSVILIPKPWRVNLYPSTIWAMGQKISYIENSPTLSRGSRIFDLKEVSPAGIEPGTFRVTREHAATLPIRRIRENWLGIFLTPFVHFPAVHPATRQGAGERGRGMAGMAHPRGGVAVSG